MDRNGVLIVPQSNYATYYAPEYPLVYLEFDETDMTSVLNWFLTQELDILIFSAAPEGWAM